MTHGFRQRLLLAAVAAGIVAGSRLVAAGAHPVVPGFERFYTGENADAARGGQLLLVELSCVSCHEPSTEKGSDRAEKGSDPLNLRGQTPFPSRAPVLDRVAARVRVGYLRKFLSDPQAVKPGTTMPNVFAAGAEREQKVEALVHFLASTGSLKHERPDNKGVATGRDLYHKVGCVACHGSRDSAGNHDRALATSVPLGNLKAKYSIAGLGAFLD